MNSEEGRPNVLILMADQLRYDCVGYSGMVPVATPHIDRLAEEGIWFDSAFCHFPVCGPVRQSLVCGQRPDSFGGLWNFSMGLKVGALEPGAYSWARTLKAGGYRCGYVGKWDVHPDYDPTFYGYDEYVDSRASHRRMVRERYPEVRYTNGYLGETDPLPLEDANTHWTARQAVELLATLASSGSPWHLRVNFTEPHLPCRPAQPFAGRYGPGDAQEWGSFSDTFQGKPYIQAQQLRNWGIETYGWDDWAPIVARYYAVISQLDDAVGRLLKQLEELGLRNNTWVIFTTDHGDMCGGHRMLDKHYVMYEDVVRVPLVMRWPGVIPAGQRTCEMVYNLLDLPPTILDACGLAAPETHRFHGRSQLKLITCGVSDASRQEVVASYNGQQFGLYTQRMIRTREWKYVWNLTDVDELYDLRRDPYELHNQIDHPGNASVAQELRKNLYDILLSDGDPMVCNGWLKRQLLGGQTGLGF
ncbi:sulfatase-like hydrolase/transferase [Paenibacillus filicis]|uniref:Sulfatase-like hydrolase/transferase n=1 Tax=Paenibacillus gyeongsangnamensis TaxID=3388067 RepID=A0ABT4QKI7_9BACL|nr:sulfatase-like hydrolase/transferase [Paenibacillus filicis]MCZ8517380.1 sulfatase-like hydrolase/transferase [Paenibacillus filicis]